MARVTIKVLGTDAVRRELEKMAPRAIRAVEAGLYLEANNVMRDSKRKVPVDLGTLRNSGYVTLPETQGNRVLVELGYGGAAKDYAVMQHERTDFAHPDGGQAKFLESVINERAGSIGRNVAIIAQRAFAANAGVTPNPDMPQDPYQGGR